MIESLFKALLLGNWVRIGFFGYFFEIVVIGNTLGKFLSMGVICLDCKNGGRRYFCIIVKGIILGSYFKMDT